MVSPLSPQSTFSGTAARSHLRSRRSVYAFVAAAGLMLGSSYSLASRELDDLAGALSLASSAVVVGADVRWEPSRGAVADAVLGRRVLFLGSEAAGGARDVYRARVRVTPEGRVLGVAGVHNITATPLGDDHALVVNGSRAAFATFAYGQVQSLTALDLSGEGGQNLTEKAHDRAMAFVTNVQQTGQGAGVGRVDITFDEAPKAVGLRLAGSNLTVEQRVGDHGTLKSTTFDLTRAEGPGLHAQPAKHLPKPVVFWAVDTVRAVPAIGPAPIAWLEERVFAVKDLAKRTSYRVSGDTGGQLRESDIVPPAKILETDDGSEDRSWPPGKLARRDNPEAGEGEWEVPKMPWLKRAPTLPGAEAPPPAFYKTFVRPDDERPYAKVLLLAMDMRQLDLDMEAGVEDPKPMTGPPGSGRLPRDPKIYTRVAAAFNGGFKTEHGNYGMMVRRRVLLPPQPGAAAVLVLADGRVGMGSWGTAKDLSGFEGIADAEILSFRQNLDPLLDQGKVNPMGRALWGFTLPGTSMQTERSGICVSAAGHMYYAWGDDVSANTLGKAMKMAGCTYGMHLDMNPHHTGLILTNITEFKGKNYKSELLTTKMEISPDRYIEYAPKDFFFMLTHDPTPPPLGKAEYTPDPGSQPAPAWTPSVFRAQDGSTRVLRIAAGRASFRVRGGRMEPDPKTGAVVASQLDGPETRRVFMNVSLGVAEPKHFRALITDGKTFLPPSTEEHMALLVVNPQGQLSIVSRNDATALPESGDAVELPLLFDGATDHGAPHGASAAHTALGVTTAGDVLLATDTSSLKSAVAALRESGCVRAVLLHRGAGQAGRIDRTGTDHPPRAHYDDTSLFVLGQPARPRGFRFDPKNPVAPPTKK
jgi:hypothetical protein